MQVTRHQESPPKGFIKKIFYKRKRTIRFRGEMPHNQLYKLDKIGYTGWTQGVSGFSGASGYSGIGFSGYSGPSGLTLSSTLSAVTMSSFTMSSFPKHQAPATRTWYIELKKLKDFWRIEEVFNWDSYGLRTRLGDDQWSGLSSELYNLEFKRLRDVKDWIFIESL